MIHSGKVEGKPLVLYTGTKADITGLSTVGASDAGAVAYATDTNCLMVYDGSAWTLVLSDVLSSFLALPGLRAFWPMSSVDYAAANRARDLSGQGYHLTDNNTPTFSFDGLAPYVEFGGVNQYLSRADGGAANWADITGTETYIDAGVRGLTIGGWFWFDNAAGANAETPLSKWMATGNQRGYMIQRRPTTGVGRFTVSTDGIASIFATTTSTISKSSWHFIVGRFDPSVEVSVYLDGTFYTTLVSIPASIADGTESFKIGAIGGPTAYLDGRASMCFLCATALSDEIISNLYRQSYILFNA